MKLDFIIDGECAGKNQFLIIVLLGLILTFTVSGVGGLRLILEVLYHLLQEGKISKTVYTQVVKVLSKCWFGKAYLLSILTLNINRLQSLRQKQKNL